MRTALLVAAAVVVAACSRNGTPPPAESTDTGSSSDTAASAPATEAPAPRIHRVNLLPTQGNKATGTLELEMTTGGVRVTGSITGLKKNSDHGFHIHETGDCTAPDASSAGAHFNPTGQPHGDPSGGEHHAGDVPNLRADEQGTARVEILVPDVSLGDGGMNDIVGKAFVVHANPDDYKTQPSGGSGARIACGVIE